MEHGLRSETKRNQENLVSGGCPCQAPKFPVCPPPTGSTSPTCITRAFLLSLSLFLSPRVVTIRLDFISAKVRNCPLSQRVFTVPSIFVCACLPLDCTIGSRER